MDIFKKVSLGNGLFVMVDEDDFNQVSKNLWSLSSGNYACTTINGKMTLMHRVIMNPPKGKVVDHIDGDRLDNRKQNLRICTQDENIQNQLKHNRNTSSKYKGVTWNKNYRAWNARIRHKTTLYGLGTYYTESEAAFVYNLFSGLLRPKFGKVNIIDVEIDDKKIISRTIIKKMCKVCNLSSIEEEELLNTYCFGKNNKKPKRHNPKRLSSQNAINALKYLKQNDRLQIT